MKSSKLIDLYQRGIRNFCGEDLKGQSFKGKNLAGIDLSGADIRGADFTYANLREANFSRAVAGCNSYWIIFQLAFGLFLLFGLNWTFFIFIRSLSPLFSPMEYDSLEKVITAISILMVVVLVWRRAQLAGSISNYLSGLQEGAVSASPMNVDSNGTKNLSRIENFLTSLSIKGKSIAFLLIFTLGFLFSLKSFRDYIFSVLVAAFASVVTFSAEKFILIGEKIDLARQSEIFDQLSYMLGGVIGISLVYGAMGFVVLSLGVGLSILLKRRKISFIVFLFSIIPFYYVAVNSWRLGFTFLLSEAMVGILLRYLQPLTDDCYIVNMEGWTPIFIYIGRYVSSLGGTSFRDADLTGANFSSAQLFSADFRRAQLSHVNWRKSKSLETARLFGSNLENPRVQQHVSSGNGKNWSFYRKKTHQMSVTPVLSNMDLREFDLEKADLRAVSLDGSMFNNALMKGAMLNGSSLKSTDLRNADLRDIDLRDVDLRSADLRGADLRGADLSALDLSEFDFSGTDLRGANLSKAQALGTVFRAAKFTGACLEDWNINAFTELDSVSCEYIYLKRDRSARRPREGIFSDGEFTALFQKAIDTIDLIFADGINWQAFFISFQEMRQQYNDTLEIQAIEKKSGNSFVIRMEVPAELDKTSIEQAAKSKYDNKLKILEATYKETLKAKDIEIESIKRANTNMLEIARILASRPINIKANATAMAQDNQRKIDFGKASIYGTAYNEGDTHNAFKVERDKDLATAAREIQTLLEQLDKSYPTETMVQRADLAQVAANKAREDKSLSHRLSRAIDAGAVGAISELLNHPAAAFFIEAIKEWNKK